MADRPILFSAPMVRALLAGTKTQTRRLLTPQPKEGLALHRVWSLPGGRERHAQFFDPAAPISIRQTVTPRIAVGDRLYVREHWRVSQKWDRTAPRDLPPRTMIIFFEAGGSIANQANGKWEPDNDYPPSRPEWCGKPRRGMHMPRWASRITLTVTDVRVERLQSCSAADAKAEGAPGLEWNDWRDYGGAPNYRGGYRQVWEKINGTGSWDVNPWVAAYTFTVALGNIDDLAGSA